MDMRFGTWNVRSMYRAGSLRTVAEEISKYKLDLVGVQEVRCDRGGTEPTGKYKFFIERRLRIMNYVQVFSYIRESYQQL
jgi:exonuclease III